MKKRKLFISVICIFLALLMAFSLILSVIPARAISESELEQLQNKRLLLEQQLAEQAAVIEALNENQALIIDRKAALDRQIEINRQTISLLEDQIAAYDGLIAEKEAELTAAEAAETEQSQLFRARLRAMEESGNYSYFTFLLESESFSDLLSRVGDIGDIMRYDRQLEEDLRQARAEVEELKAEYETVREEQASIRRELADKSAQLASQLKAACDLIAQLDSLSADAAAEYAAIEAAEAEAFAQEQQALAEYAAQLEAARRAAWLSYSGPVSGGTAGYGTYTGTYGSASAAASGGFIWPVDSTYITSNYGYRISPTAGASSFHQAIDIGAAAGSPIYAVADGQVAMATYNNGLGNYVSIAHGDDTATRYSHMTNFVVQPGEYVTQGQIIGYVGSTGIATGDHLDFAVIQDGQQVDPLQFYDSSALVFDPTA